MFAFAAIVLNDVTYAQRGKDLFMWAINLIATNGVCVCVCARVLHHLIAPPRVLWGSSFCIGTRALLFAL